jgi:acetyl esterase/lipase
MAFKQINLNWAATIMSPSFFMMYRIFLKIIFFASLITSALASADSNIKIGPLKADRICRSGEIRILPSPNSDKVVIWKVPQDLRDVWAISSSTSFSIIDVPMDGGTDGSKLSGSLITASDNDKKALRLSGIYPIQWNEQTNELLFFFGNSGTGILNADDRSITLHKDRDPRWTNGPVFALSHGRLDFYLKSQNIDVLQSAFADGEPIRNNITVAGSEISALVFRLGAKHQLWGFDKKGRWNTRVPLAFAHTPLINPRDRSMSYLGHQLGFDSFLPFSQPLIDLQVGAAAGRFGLDVIEQDRRKPLDLKDIFGHYLTIKDAKQNGDAIFALIELGEEQRLVRIRNGQVDSWNYCTKQDTAIGTIKLSPSRILTSEERIERTVLAFEKSKHGSGDRAFAMLYEPKDTNGKLLVYFHGGPALSHVDDAIPSIVHKFVRRGVSVLAVEYSGMVGGGMKLSRRLAKRGHEAISEDVKVVTMWIRRSDYKSVFLLGDSFGGIPAATAATQYSTDYDHIFLTVPVLALRPFVDAVNRKKMIGERAASVERQREFEYLVYGDAKGRERFSKSLKASTSKLRPSSRLSFYFGSKDLVSSVNDLPVPFAGHASVQIYNTDHNMYGMNEKMIDDIFSKMGSPVSR